MVTVLPLFLGVVKSERLSRSDYVESVGQQSKNNNPKFPSWHILKLKILIIELKKLVLLCQHMLHVKQTTSLYVH